MFYTTEYVMNLSNGTPFCFDVSDETLSRLEHQKALINQGKAPMLGSIEELTRYYEFSFFPSYKELLKIFFENGYTDELMTEILKDFGVPESFIPKLLEDEEYVSKIKPWFEGITCDGSRASRTLIVVYEKTKVFFTQ